MNEIGQSKVPTKTKNANETLMRYLPSREREGGGGGNRPIFGVLLEQDMPLL